MLIFLLVDIGNRRVKKEYPDSRRLRKKVNKLISHHLLHVLLEYSNIPKLATSAVKDSKDGQGSTTSYERFCMHLIHRTPVSSMIFSLHS